MMRKIKNTTQNLKYFILLTTFVFIASCADKKNVISKIETQKISITDKYSSNYAIEEFIKPFKDHIDKDLNVVLAYNPETLDKKDGKWQTNIGNLIADVCFQRGNIIFKKRENKQMDLCLLNYGGIRSILPKGNITTKVAYQIMPFENSLYILELKGIDILEMINYIIKEKKPHPLSGMSFTIKEDNTPINILIQGKPLDTNKIYNVGTIDYLANGGDNMNFFKKNIGSYDMNYKLRNIFIDYLIEVDTVKVDKSIRIFEEKK